ncbi:glycosyltransferase family 4 protein [Achromobacter animicus]|uniref:glycosyltransferase family 4 protein n=1 Tax=Achromobacter animicus TaxID=1389935 RepID=UPI0028A6F414|nr:glycosyltransferase family 4 protein [Achromobacter animicus]
MEQATWLQHDGHGVAIAAPAASAVNREARKRGINVIDIDFSRSYAPASVFALRRAIKALRVDVIDSHSRADGKTAALCRDLCAVVRTRHFAKPMRTSLRRRFEWKMGCDHVIATSQLGKQELLSAQLVPEERISVVGEWATDRFFSGAAGHESRTKARYALGMQGKADDYVVATVGMLRPEKGQADLLRVVHRLRSKGIPATALVMGMPTPRTHRYAEHLHRLAADLQIAQHVCFAGHREDVAETIHAADVVLVPSATEAWSRIVPEAFAARIPVVASRVGGLPEIIAQGATGWLAPAGDVDSFAERIAHIRLNPAVAERVVENARAYADANFRLAKQMARTLKVYSLVARTGQ